MGDSNNPYTTLSDTTQPQSQNRTLRNGSASDRKGPTPRKDEHTGNNAVTNAIPRIVYRNCVNQEPFPFKVTYSHKQISLVHVVHIIVKCRAARGKRNPAHNCFDYSK